MGAGFLIFIYSKTFTCMTVNSSCKYLQEMDSLFLKHTVEKSILVHHRGNLLPLREFIVSEWVSDLHGGNIDFWMHSEPRCRWGSFSLGPSLPFQSFWKLCVQHFWSHRCEIWLWRWGFVLTCIICVHKQCWPWILVFSSSSRTFGGLWAFLLLPSFSQPSGKYYLPHTDSQDLSSPPPSASDPDLV